MQSVVISSPVELEIARSQHKLLSRQSEIDDREAGVGESEQDEIGSRFGVKDLVIKVGPAEQINENVAGVKLSSGAHRGTNCGKRASTIARCSAGLNSVAFASVAPLSVRRRSKSAARSSPFTISELAVTSRPRRLSWKAEWVTLKLVMRGGNIRGWSTADVLVGGVLYTRSAWVMESELLWPGLEPRRKTEPFPSACF